IDDGWQFPHGEYSSKGGGTPLLVPFFLCCLSFLGTQERKTVPRKGWEPGTAGFEKLLWGSATNNSYYFSKVILMAFQSPSVPAFL
ncbi:MAG: hypothetical protein PUC32_00320, partial [Oscillospiraceae bacterium]|nr:hypothetical protein [Oscillospiraceae bacterium]